MAHDEVDAGSGGDRPRRGSHWRAAVVAGIVVLGTAIAVPVVYGSSEAPTRGRPAMMMDRDQMSEMMRSGPMMQPGQMMPGGMMMGSAPMMDPAQMAEIMNSGPMMGPGPMMGGRR